MITIIGGDWGFIPGFLDERDPRPAVEQIKEKYSGGWWSMKHRLTFDDKTGVLLFPGDPPFKPIGGLYFRDEMLLLYPGDFVVILQPDDTWDAARMD